MALLYIREFLTTDIKTKILIAPADHRIAPKQKFLKILKIFDLPEIFEFVTFGIKPEYPETNYGYIKTGSSTSLAHGLQRVEQFIEKPHIKKARSYYMKQNYYWNSGMFLFTIDSFFKNFEKLTDSASSTTTYAKFLKKYPILPNISFDKAFMEKTIEKRLFPLTNIKWVDLGIKKNFLPHK